MNQNDPPAKSRWQRYLPLTYALVLGSASVVMFLWAQSLFEGGEVVIEGTAELSGQVDFEDERLSDREFEMLVEKTDQQLLDKLRQIKESRQPTQGREEAVRHYEQQIEDRRDELEKLTKDVPESLRDKNSIAYGLKKEMDKIEQDSPLLGD